jgi:predicted enzyme involved in methoxymalonyl-ACP biosynthesis
MAGEKPLITESEVDTLISSGNCYLVTVGDRLCSHGPSGVLVTRAESGALVVESLSLSCTVLGKQVEFAVLSALEQYAATQDRSAIVFEYRPSGRNQPMATFLSSVVDADHDGYFRVSVEELNSRIQRAATNPTAWNLTIG